MDLNTDLIDLKIDYAFKLIFGREGQEPVLVAFLNAILKPPEDKLIESLSYTNSELGRENAEDKKASLDIRAETKDGRHINIEIQLENQHDMAKRSLYYWAELFSRQLVKNKAYKTLKDTITINILDFNYLKETEEFHSVFSLLELQKHFQLTEALRIDFIELPRLRRKWKAREVSPKGDPLVRWLFLLDGNDNGEIRKELEVLAVEDPMIERALKDWEVISADPQLRELYFDRKKAIQDELAAVEAAKLNAEEAEIRGEVRGKALMAQDIICQYLEMRFGAESHALQKTIRGTDDLDTLNRVVGRVFHTTSLDEAAALVQDSIVAQ